MKGRPASVTAVAVVILLMSAATALGGLALTLVSNCCGSSDPADPAPTFAGLAAAGVLVAAAAGLLTGRMPSWLLHVLALVLTSACFVAALDAVDLQTVLVALVAGWAVLAVLLRHPGPAAWVGSRAQRPE